MNSCDGCQQERYMENIGAKMHCVVNDIEQSSLYPHDFIEKCICGMCLVKLTCEIWCNKRIKQYKDTWQIT